MVSWLTLLGGIPASARYSCRLCPLTGEPPVRYRIVSVGVILVLLAGCGTAKRAVPVKTGPGVTDDTITLGVLSDQTGPFSPTAPSRNNGYGLVVDDINAQGGVCGRKLHLNIADHGYKVDRALREYFDLEPKVLGFLDVTGTAMMEAIAPDLLQSRVLAAPITWTPSLLGHPSMMLVGSTYDLDIINGLSKYKKDGVLADGDTVGHVYVDSDFGRVAVEGSKFAADQWRLNLLTKSIPEGGTEAVQAISELKAAGAKVVIVSTQPQQTTSAIGSTEALKWEVPMLISGIGIDPSILKTPLAQAVIKRVLFVTAMAPNSADLPGPKMVAKEYKEKYPNAQLTPATNHAYALGLAFAAVLRKACADGDLTRDGVLRAFRATDRVDTQSLTGPLRFSQVGRPPTDESYLAKADPSVLGAFALVAGPYSSDLAKLKAGKPR
ncbi:ABC transporter substrate-binding protein [Pseudonocardiaceae bacterium YIM PH 21723]|nr:ABC transporter substrate-binding protein [Pseudonocardiaceae bacterium YIM PH 21723]